MKEKMDKEIMDRLYIIMMILLLIFMISTSYLIIHYSEELKSNPLIYGAKRFGNIECTCIKYDSQGVFQHIFAFNSSLLWSLNNNQNLNQIFINPINIGE